ncbi:MAG: nuclear transport factor 2 family protein [Saprospiraceae bacterium]|nr:nuclear transport factor 2 family protein [Saprospiraceae bacterium]
MKGLQTIAITALFGLIFSCGTTQSNSSTEKETNMSISNKEKAVALLNSLSTGDQTPISYINPEKYIQHNLAVGDGLAGFGAVVAAAPPGGFKAKVIRAFEDGDFVFTHTEYDFFGPKIGFDVFRFEDGLIVEHWDNLQETATETASGRTQIDGPTASTDLAKTEENKTFIKGFMKDILMGEQPDKITDYVSTEEYAQHNPGVKDGLAGLGEAIEALAKTGMPMEYHKNHFVLGEGNFVLTGSEGKFMNKAVAFYDLFRIENGKIVEHWDTIEEIPARSEWKNENGKF